MSVETLRLWLKQADLDAGRRSDGLMSDAQHGDGEDIPVADLNEVAEYLEMNVPSECARGSAEP